MRWNVAKDIVVAWIVTMPAAALMGAGFYLIANAGAWRDDAARRSCARSRQQTAGGRFVLAFLAEAGNPPGHVSEDAALDPAQRLAAYGLSLAQSAANEALEEAGMKGDVSAPPLGHYRYIKDKQGAALPIRVEVFALKVTEQSHVWPEKGTRKVLWLPPDQAAHRVAEAGLKNILMNFRASRVVAA